MKETTPGSLRGDRVLKLEKRIKKKKKLQIDLWLETPSRENWVHDDTEN